MITVKFSNRSIRKSGKNAVLSYTLKILVGESEAVSKIMEHRVDISNDGWHEKLLKKVSESVKEIKARITESVTVREIEASLDSLERELSE